MTPAESAAIDREQVTTLYREKIATLRAEIERLVAQRNAAWREAAEVRSKRDAVAAVLDDVLKERDEWRQVAETSHRLHCEASDRDLAARAESGAMRGALREVVEWCDAGRCIEGIQVGGGLEAALSAARAALKGTR